MNTYQILQVYFIDVLSEPGLQELGDFSRIFARKAFPNISWVLSTLSLQNQNDK